jgi:predicted nuclease of predicted toxin-antitoxin system
MARFYADEQFPLPVVELLRNLGHDVLTVQEAGNANQRIPDEQVLAFAVSQERAILTINRIRVIARRFV